MDLLLTQAHKCVLRNYTREITLRKQPDFYDTFLTCVYAESL